MAFMPNPENKRCINHINGIRSDNRVENLEWCTHSENEIHSYKVLKKKTNGILRRKIKVEDIEKIKSLCKSGLTQKEVGIMYNVSQSVIQLLVNKKTYVKWI